MSVLAEDDAVRQAAEAATLDPTSATREQVEAAAEFERRIREEQRDLVVAELARLGLDYAVIVARSVPVAAPWSSAAPPSPSLSPH